MAANPVTIESGVALRLTISAGVAVLPEDGSWLERLSVAADRSLDAAKGGGRNRVMTRAELAEGFKKQRTGTARAGLRDPILRLARHRKKY